MRSAGISGFTDEVSREFKTGTNVLLILHSLVNDGGPIYGYEVIQRIKRASQDQICLSPSSVYPLFKRLEKHHLVTSVWSGKSTAKQGIPRKYYTITLKGRRVYQHIHDKWSSTIHMIENTLNNITRENL